MLPTTLLADPALVTPRARIRTAPRTRSAAPGRPIRWGRLAAVLAVAFLLGSLAFLREWPPVATVMSGSMAPTINTGDMVVLQHLERPAAIGDVVVVNVPDEARSRYGYPAVVIHRIVQIGTDGTVTTKGDARKERDPFNVPRAALSAHVVAKIPAGGHILAFLSSGLGLLWLAAGGVFLLAMPLLDKRRDVRHAADAGLAEQLRTITEELVELRYERTTLEHRCDTLSQQACDTQEQLRLVTEQLVLLPAQLAGALASAQPAPPAPDPEPEPEPLDPLAELELALFAAPATGAPPVDESGPQLAFLLDVERRPRFARPCEHQLALGLEPGAAPAGQLALAPPPPPPPPPAPEPPAPPAPGPRWDTTPPGFTRARRRSGGLVGHTRIALSVGVERFRAVAQAAATS